MTPLNSRYRNFNKFYDFRSYRDIDSIVKNNPKSYYIVRQNDLIENIATFFYNDPTLYWVILAANHVYHPFRKLIVGRRLIVPDEKVVDILNEPAV